MKTFDKPKKVKDYKNPEEENFTGFVKDKNNCLVYYLNGEIQLDAKYYMK